MKRFLFVLLIMATPVMAVEPDEVLSDPILEARAREVSKGLRCLVCRNESIDESNASLARDLRLILRERLVAGDSDQAAVDFIVARYGEYVLLKPDTSGANWWLWAAGPLMLIGAGGVGFGYLRSRSRATPRGDTPLDEAEKERLRDILEQ